MEAVKYTKLMTSGNSKLDRSILCYSQTPIKSCPNCSSCSRSCYALKAYRMHPIVRRAWDRNYEISKNSAAFIETIVAQLKKSCKTTVRIHVAGDFYSAEYIMAWHKLATMFPDTHFYGYSKAFEILPEELEAMNALENVNIINSIAPDGLPNFGGVERVKGLIAEGYIVCPVTAGIEMKCGGTGCTLCQTESKICFHLH